jgi:DnaJ-class molecular chaperone
MKDYYTILDIQRSDGKEAIAEGYKRAIIKYHPSLTRISDTEAAKKAFDQASEAFEVLIDETWRSIYDTYGEEVLKKGFKIDEDNIPGYRYKQNAEEIYHRYTLNFNPFTNIIDFDASRIPGSMFGNAFGGLNCEYVIEPIHVYVTVECTLAEVYIGCFKTIQFERRVFNPDRRTTHVEQVTKQILIKPGYSSKTVLEFKEEGSDSMSCPRGDLIVSIAELTHTHFTRDGNDLHYNVELSLYDALTVVPIHVSTFDGRELIISVDETINPSLIKKISNEGMPIILPGEPTQAQSSRGLDHRSRPKGDLYIHFNIVMPEALDPSYFPDLRSILPIAIK